jgi:hypothetical protein
MARIRTTKPEFWSDGKIVTLSPVARLLFLGSWNFAICDDGHLPDDAMGLKLKVLPADQVDPVELLDELLAVGVIVRGETFDGRSYLHIPHLRDHQKVDGRWTPRCFVCAAQKLAKTPPASPELPETRASLDETHRDSPELPETPPRKGKEGKGREKNVDAPASPPREDVEALCEHLRRRVVANGSKAEIVASWRTDARLLLDRDKRAVGEAHALIDWCQDDMFWRGNILSIPTFRKQYDKLRLQAQAKGGLQLPVAAGGERTWTVAQLDAVLGPDMWRLPRPPAGLMGDDVWHWEQKVKADHRAERVAQAQAKLGISA